MMKNVLRTLAVSGVLLGGTTALAAPVELSNAVFKETIVRQPDGTSKRALSPAATVTPGEQVVYVLTIRNTGTLPAEQLVVTNPVPSDVAFVAAEDAAAAKLSVGGERFGALSEFTVTTADGRARPALPADVTHLRWELADPLAPNSERQVSYRGRLK